MLFKSPLKTSTNIKPSISIIGWEIKFSETSRWENDGSGMKNKGQEEALKTMLILTTGRTNYSKRRQIKDPCGKYGKEIPFARQLDVERSLFLCPDILDWSQGHYPVQCWTSDRSGAHRRRLTSRSSSRRLSLACWAMVFFSSNNCWVSRMYSWMMSTVHA